MTDAVPRSARSRGRIAPARMAHVVLRTNRYDEMIAWWKAVLELEAMHANPFITFLTFDEEHHRIAIARLPNLKDKVTNAVGVDHFAFSYASVGDLLATVERLAEQGIRPSTSIHHGVTLSFYYLDPDRNQVELQVDAFRTQADLNAFLAGGVFARNPIGVLFDGDALVKRWREGASDAELLRPLEGGPPDMGTVFAEH
jgi:catechol 2,3-dioxygenase-like lactoylglutathione lyase family enzyme